MKTKILDYNKAKAQAIFAFLKFSEIFAIFLFFFGFEWLGHLSYDLFLSKFILDAPQNYAEFWLCGVLSLVILMLVALLILVVLYILFVTMELWLKSNWRWSKILAEDSSSKVKRLREKNKIKRNKVIDEMLVDRINLGVCVGDKVKIKNKLVEDSYYGGRNFVTEMRFSGMKKVVSTCSSGFELTGMDDYTYTKEMIGNVDKHKILKTSKINKQYIEDGTSLGTGEQHE